MNSLTRWDPFSETPKHRYEVRLTQKEQILGGLISYQSTTHQAVYEVSLERTT